MGMGSLRATAAGDWHRIRLSRDEYEGGEVEVIQGAFRAIYIATNGPPGMAMLGASEDGRDGGYCVYFTPPSFPHVRPLLKAYAAVACDPPTRRGLALLYGDPSAARLTFREF